MKINAELQRISAEAIEKGFELLGNGKKGLVPFAMTESTDGDVGMHQFDSESLDEAIHLARAYVRRHAEAIDKYGIVTLGFVSIAGTKREAMLVEAGEIGGDLVITVAQGFKRKGIVRKRIKRVGKVAIFGRSEAPLGFEDFGADDELDEEED